MKLFVCISFLLVGLISCKKFLNIPPPKTEIGNQVVYSTNESATSALLGIYSKMENETFNYYLVLNTGISSDEFLNYSNSLAYDELSNNNLTADNKVTLANWIDCYEIIFQANALLEGLEKSKKLSNDIKNRLSGEARFIRAYCNFILVNLFGDIPLVKTTNPTINSKLNRTSIILVYNFIKEDLNSAAKLLTDYYVNSNNEITEERVRPNKWTALALLAKVHLYLQEWNEAINISNLIVENNNYQIQENLNDVFLKNSKESIWQLMCTNPRQNTQIGAQFILNGVPSVVSIRESFIKTFTAKDKRKSEWINNIKIGTNTYYYPFKYKKGKESTPISEYTNMFRLSEIILIRAEAKARNNNIIEACEDVNIIRKRAGLDTLLPGLPKDILDSINIERKHELFAESGDRWFNLKRTNTSAQILEEIKVNTWKSSDALYPIPQQEILKNPNLTQNDGY